jgi:TatD DNase family protein
MIDFHCHLDLYPNPHEVARRCEEKGLFVLSVTTTPSAWKGTLALERGRIRTALGLHPQLAHERMSELDLFDQLIGGTRYVGEIGLDGAPEFQKSWDEQLTVFDHVLSSCTKAGGRILSIHSRRAAATVLDRLASYSDAGIPVLHWFTGSPAELDRADRAGCWFSVGPAMLRSERGRELVSRMPRDRVLTESDGPFAQIDQRSLFPWDVATTLAALSKIWLADKDTVRATLLSNLECLIRQASGESADSPSS